ncbi:hypothetical protein AVEN_225285-1 [Araneus ventricosus]|uniref:Uncharacterized protein n=1 Tax=Araneus ventricosus TaxID=182803 RepID=A0A4Y2AN02_ARAVE|nr:hypothetical protein AVEN_225285-1 [Araneus ventricosus]
MSPIDGAEAILKADLCKSGLHLSTWMQVDSAVDASSMLSLPYQALLIELFYMVSDLANIAMRKLQSLPCNVLRGIWKLCQPHGVAVLVKVPYKLQLLLQLLLSDITNSKTLTTWGLAQSKKETQ